MENFPHLASSGNALKNSSETFFLHFLCRKTTSIYSGMLRRRKNMFMRGIKGSVSQQLNE